MQHRWLGILVMVSAIVALVALSLWAYRRGRMQVPFPAQAPLPVTTPLP